MTIYKDDPKKFDKLTDKQKLACQEYLVDLSATNALKRAGYATTYAESQQSRFFSKQYIIDYMNWLRKKTIKKSGMTPEEVVQRLMRIAERAERDDELPSALRALELLGKHMAMFTDKQITTVQENPWATGDTPEARKVDTERLLRVAAPKLKVVNGGKEE